MHSVVLTIGIVLIVWILINLKTSRGDGTLLTNLHPYRYIIPFIMRTRNTAIVYFDIDIQAQPLLSWIEKQEEIKIKVVVTYFILALLSRI